MKYLVTQIIILHTPVIADIVICALQISLIFSGLACLFLIIVACFYVR